MAWVAVNKDGTEMVFPAIPKKDEDYWIVRYKYPKFYDNRVRLPKGSIKKLIGRELDWSSEPVELEG